MPTLGRCCAAAPLLCLALLAACCADAGDGGGGDAGAAPVVDIADGKVRGRVMTSRAGRRFYAYLGIPYARPPVGPLRFENPREPEKWDDILDATKEGSPCPQLKYPELKYIGKEDCLYVNVFTHNIAESFSVEEMDLQDDVIVVMHGGRFTTGSGSVRELSPEHIMDYDVVLVTFNYRLGPLGFLAAGHPDLPGNYGLKDQQRLLTWVRRNIMYFDGNMGSVTLLGHEAGAASAHYHAISDYSRQRFDAVISLSGSALSPWAHVPTAEARRRAFSLGRRLGCPEEQLADAQGLRGCLAGKSAKALVRRAANLTDVEYPFVPALEPFMPRNRTVRYNTTERMIEFLGRRSDQPSWLVGTNSRDGRAQASKLFESGELLQQLNEDPSVYLPKYLGIVTEDSGDIAARIGQRAWDYYMGDQTLSETNMDKLIELTGDFNTFYGVAKSIDLHTIHTTMPMFVYHFDWKKEGLSEDYDFRLMFPKTEEGKKTELTAEEFKFVDRLLHIVTNFAHEKDPTPEPDAALDDVTWQDAVLANYTYLLLDERLDLRSGGVRGDRVAFWDSVLEELRAHHLENEEAIRAEQQRLYWQQEDARAADEATSPPNQEEVTKDQIVKLEL